MKFDKDPKFSVIVPVYDVPADVFKRCLMSISDQDYQELEVVIVANGGDKEAEKMAREYAQGRENWKVLFTEEKGACQARNLGFKESNGEIVAFVNSDYILKTGIIRVWVDELLKHPECGFAYGGYEYRSQNSDAYESKPFDIYQLQVANYIDCGFPIWRQHVKEWDPEVKSLQDWDFWLSVVKSGVKGHYLGREYSFIAEVPRPKGLSHDSTDHWVERVSFIKQKHGIPLRDICVASIGAKTHAVKIAQAIGADYRDDTLHKPHNYKALYLIGWYMKPGEDNGHARILQMFPKSKRIVHFVGADIYWLRMFSAKVMREFAGALKMNVDHLLCENEMAQEELASYGIDAKIVPIPPYTDLELTPLPKEFSVALYLSDKSDFDKYCQKETLSIVKAMPDVKFYGYGDSSLEFPEGKFTAKNFTMAGTLTTEEWAKFVQERSAYLRLVRHDTRPMASDEFILAGRSVITNIPNEMMDYIDTSGRLPFDQWDKFGPGFSAIRWPETKKRIIQKIREVRRQQKEGRNDFEGERIARSIAFKSILRKDLYTKTIREMALETKLEVVHVG